MKIKIFAQSDRDQAEAEINAWLDMNPNIKVEHVTQTQVFSESKDNSLLTISIFYDDRTDAPTRRGFQ